MVLITMTNCKDRSSGRTTSNVISNQSTSDRVIVNWSLVLVCHAVLRALVNWLLLWCRRIYLSRRGVATLGWPLWMKLWTPFTKYGNAFKSTEWQKHRFSVPLLNARQMPSLCLEQIEQAIGKVMAFVWHSIAVQRTCVFVILCF
jgi:hypothetical protein